MIHSYGCTCLSHPAGRRSQCKTLQTSSHIYAPYSTVRQQGANWTMMDYRSALLFLIICFM
ncbi:hypothetical protein AMECASPLE_039476, partial [Ameca splendens]